MFDLDSFLSINFYMRVVHSYLYGDLKPVIIQKKIPGNIHLVYGIHFRDSYYYDTQYI